MKTAYLLFVPFLCFSSCTMFTHGGAEKLKVVSEPSGADVRLSSGEKGVTPVTFAKSRKEHFTVTVSKAGYAAQTIEVSSLKPNPVSIHLVPRGKSSIKSAAPKTKPEGATTPTKEPQEATATPTPTSSPTPEQTAPETTNTPSTEPTPEQKPTETTETPASSPPPE